ncbi:MAG: hypothetical protein J7J17_00010 [Hadesarchaea archaeon]|nr:hypothetical protein [Hadesarchaea archaeon]
MGSLAWHPRGLEEVRNSRQERIASDGGDEVAVCNEGYPEIPSIWGLSFAGSLKTDLPCLRVKIC